MQSGAGCLDTHIWSARAKKSAESNLQPRTIDPYPLVGVTSILPVRCHPGSNSTIVNEGVDSALIIHPERVCTIAALS